MNQLAQTLDAGWSEGNLNRSVLGAVSGSAGMLLATLSVRPLRDMLGLTALTPLGWGLIGTASLAAVAISRGFSSGNFPLSFSPDLAHDPKEKTDPRLP